VTHDRHRDLSGLSQFKISPDADHRTGRRNHQREPANYLFPRNDLPLEVKAFALARLGNDAQIHPARRNGSYKGTVLLNSDGWLVQVIGRNTKTAILAVDNRRSRPRKRHTPPLPAGQAGKAPAALGGSAAFLPRTNGARGAAC